MEETNAMAAIEAILFMMGESVEISKIADALEMDTKSAKVIMEKLIEKYKQMESGLSIIELDGTYQMCTRNEYYDYLIKIAKAPKKFVLTDTLLETLSIIAYKQPVTRLDIEKIRGVSCDHAVNKLIEYELITEIGRLDAPGRPLLFGTTKEFLRSFGVTSIDDLPRPDEDQIESFRQQAEDEAEVSVDI